MSGLHIIGITGRSGSGKSSVGRYYASLGYPVLDGDAISRRVTLPGSPCLQELAEEFGPEILDAQGALLRRKLAELAFATPEKNKRLVDITHPYILRYFLARVEDARRQNAELLFLDGAMILDSMFEQYCDKLIVVAAGLRLSISRIILRDGISKTAALKRLEAQPSEQRLAQAADYLIRNEGSAERLNTACEQVLREILDEYRR